MVLGLGKGNKKRRLRRREKPGVAGGERLGINPVPGDLQGKSTYAAKQATFSCNYY